MKKTLKLVRKAKALFIRLRLHRLFSPFVHFSLLLVYLCKLSQYIRGQNPGPAFNDFYSPDHRYDKRYDLYQYVMDSERLDRLYYLEFGVAEGHSFCWWLQHCRHSEARFAGFDTFHGLPEKWGGFDVGAMSTGGQIPQLSDPRCSFYPGLIQDTLPKFLRTFSTDMRKVVHCDVDIYSSALFVLLSMAPYLAKDDLVLFDEFNVPLHEFRAFLDFSAAYPIKTQCIGAVNNYHQVAFKIIA